MDRKYLKSILAAVLTVLICIGIIAYVTYHFRATSTSDVELLPATNVTVDDTNEYTAYVFRSEKVVYAPGAGVSYRVSGGQKVAADTVVARVFEKGGNDVRAQLADLDGKLAILARSSVDEGTRFAGTGIIDAQIAEIYSSIMTALADGDIDYAMRKKDELGILLNRRKILVKDVENYDEAEAALTERQEELISSLGEAYTEVKADEAGYFYTEVDGFENVFSAAKALEMDVDDFDSMISASAETYDGAKTAIGKLVTDFKWYIAIEIPESEVVRYNTEFKYNIIFPYNSDAKMVMTLERMVTSADNERCVLVFSSSEMPKDFNYLRAQTIRIVSSSYSGYRVPTSAVRVIDGVTGVYVLDGSVVRFKRIYPLVENDGYIIVEKQDVTNPDSLQNDLGYCDLIITEGRGMYEGRIIE